MRPHTEIVSVDDLVWHPAELPRSEGRARQQNLSYDEENGAASTRVFFETAWSRPGGYHEADTEWYVLAGQVRLGDQVLGPSDYVRAPAGLLVPPVTVTAGTEVLIFREFADWGFSISDASRSRHVPRGGNTASDEPGELTVVQDTQAGWAANPYGTVRPEDFQRKLKLKILYHDESPDRRECGWLTNLVWAPPGMDGTGHGVEHHHICEEGYGLSGRMDYDFGVFIPGCYFYRPPLVQHADFKDGGTGHVLLMRVNGDLINWKTENVVVETGGTAVNYDPADPGQAPIMISAPVRSRSAGSWPGETGPTLVAAGAGADQRPA
jgi:Domain of unknown function (DUF4437)